MKGGTSRIKLAMYCDVWLTAAKLGGWLAGWLCNLTCCFSLGLTSSSSEELPVYDAAERQKNRQVSTGESGGLATEAVIRPFLIVNSLREMFVRKRVCG